MSRADLLRARAITPHPYRGTTVCSACGQPQWWPAHRLETRTEIVAALTASGYNAERYLDAVKREGI